MAEVLTKEMLQRLPDENLDLAASITLTLFNQAPFFSRIKRLLKRDLRLFQGEFQARKQK